MQEVTYFVGGSTGSDPYAANTWSGSSKHLLEAMARHSFLNKAVGLKLSRSQDLWFRAKNFRLSRSIWRKLYYFDLDYRRALTNEAQSVSVHSRFCMQIGSMFSLPDVFADHTCISYNDGNLPELVQSGFGLEGIPGKTVDRVLRYEETVAQRLDGIFTFSEYLRQSFIRDFRVKPENVINVGGAVNLDSLPTPDPNKDYEVQKILFIGVEAERKGCNILLRAFPAVRERFPKAELHIVGPSSLEDLPSGVSFHGHLSKRVPDQKAKLDTLFSECTLFVLPSLYEPFGIAPLEAMCYGLPCILTNAWAFREFVTSGENGELVEKGSIDDLIAKMSEMLAAPELLAKMGDRSRNRVLERYTWDAVVARMRSALRTF